MWWTPSRTGRPVAPIVPSSLSTRCSCTSEGGQEDVALSADGGWGGEGATLVDQVAPASVDRATSRPAPGLDHASHTVPSGPAVAATSANVDGWATTVGAVHVWPPSTDRVTWTETGPTMVRCG